MSSNTWTPRAVESESLRAQRRLWRAVEAQHVASTLRLVANLGENQVLEQLLENSPALNGVGHAWFLTVRRDRVIWQREGDAFEFHTAEWQR